MSDILSAYQQGVVDGRRMAHKDTEHEAELAALRRSVAPQWTLILHTRGGWTKQVQAADATPVVEIDGRVFYWVSCNKMTRTAAYTEQA